MRMRYIKKPIRIFNFDLLDYVKGVWDENTPIVHHAVLEGVGVASEMLEEKEILRRVKLFASDLGLHIVESFAHEFHPQGSSVVFVLRESHMAVHAWPEKKYIHIDMVTCSKKGINQSKIVSLFRKLFRPASARAMKFRY